MNTHSHSKVLSIVLFSTISILVLSIAILYILPAYSTNTTSALSYQTESNMSFTFDPMISISISSNTIDIPTLAPGTTAESNPITVTVGTNTAYGYSLYADVGNSTDYNTDSLVHSSNDNSTNTNDNSNDINNNNSTPSVFTSIATNASLPSLTTDNTWGYSFKPSNESTWSTYNGLPLYTTTESHTSTSNPALLIDTKDAADSSKSIDFKIAARSSSTQPSGTYNNVINFYAVGKPAPLTLYEEVAKMSKGTQTLADLQTTITAPTSTDYHEDTSNSGVYEYNASVFGESSDASNANKIYYYRGVLEPEADQGFYGSDGKATTYPNYVKLSNDTCWRIVRTTGSSGVKMIYNGIWARGTCANSVNNARIADVAFASQGTSTKSLWYSNIHYVGYTYNNSVTDSTTVTPVDTVFGSDSDPSLNNTRSNIKTYIEDTWYANNMTSYTNKLEPSAGYCNDRTIYSGDTTPVVITTVKPYTNSNDVMFFGTYVRNYETANVSKTPSLTCSRSTVDLYRYAPNSYGVANELKYPAALLTGDEVAFAGSGRSTGTPTTSNEKSFLNSGLGFWLLSPYARLWSGYACEHLLSIIGIDGSCVDNEYGVRPAISLKPGTTIEDGSGIATDPWTINE